MPDYPLTPRDYVSIVFDLNPENFEMQLGTDRCDFIVPRGCVTDDRLERLRFEFGASEVKQQIESHDRTRVIVLNPRKGS